MLNWVDEAVVAKKVVEVALVEVEFSPVKLSKVEEPERSKLESEVKPPVAVKVPVKLAALEMVWPFTRPDVMVFEPRFKAPLEVMAPDVMRPVVRAVEKRLVELAVVEKKVVEVALVEVEFSPVKLSKVDEPESNKFEREVSPPVAVRVVPTARDPVKLAAEEIV